MALEAHAIHLLRARGGGAREGDDGARRGVDDVAAARAVAGLAAPALEGRPRRVLEEAAVDRRAPMLRLLLVAELAARDPDVVAGEGRLGEERLGAARRRREGDEQG